MAAWIKTALPDVPKLAARLVSSMHRIRYRLAGSDAIRISRIAAWHDDPASALQAAAKLARVEIAEIFSVDMSERARVTAAKPRAHDRIDLALVAAAPFGDPRILLQSREIDLQRAYARLQA